MSIINQLLAKALSTTSEDEAMACLRMARKKGGCLEDSDTAVEYNGHSAAYWYAKAGHYYNIAKLHNAQAKDYQALVKAYDIEVGVNAKYRNQIRRLKEDVRKANLGNWWKIPIIGIQVFIILVLIAIISG